MQCGQDREQPIATRSPEITVLGRGRPMRAYRLFRQDAHSSLACLREQHVSDLESSRFNIRKARDPVAPGPPEPPHAVICWRGYNRLARTRHRKINDVKVRGRAVAHYAGLEITLRQLACQRFDLRDRFAGSVCTDDAVSYTHLRAHETRHDLVCR